ncbi:MAG: ABC transporter permease, partial [Lachnospiraceae bacterium]|nr:ABC transporter permease [Lachnospiraceae bacterium]
MKQMERKLRKADRKQSGLYLFCNFTALMIISAYSALMFSPTVQTVFPEGGDSRKMMYMIFVMTLVGCVIFTIYALGLFFRHKSGQLGVLMALGASRRRLAPGLFREVLILSGVSAVIGIIAGFPFVWIIWNGFKMILVDSSDMVLSFDFRCVVVSLIFLLLVVGFACLTAWRYLKKTNIMEVIREEHINEPVKELGRWCGPVGAFVLLLGAVMG